MRENIADGFKFSRKSGRFVFLSLGLVPAVLLWGAYASGVSIIYDLSCQWLWMTVETCLYSSRAMFFATHVWFVSNSHFLLFFIIFRVKLTWLLAERLNPFGEAKCRYKLQNTYIYIPILIQIIHVPTIVPI